MWVRGASYREDVVDDLPKPHGIVGLHVGNLALVVDVNIATLGVLVLVLRPEVGATQLEPKWL